MKKLQNLYNNRTSTLFLRAALLGMGAFILFLCVLMFPAFLDIDEIDFRPVVVALYVAAVPFYFALYQAWLLLNYIDRNLAFSEESIKTLAMIRNAAAVIAGLFVLYWPIFYSLAQADDAPGVFAISLMITGMSVVIAVFAELLRKLFRNAVDIKSENDLTV